MSSGGRYAKGVAKREHVLDVALETFERTGYDKASFREIAREAGLSQAGLLHYFSSKQELYVEVLRRRDRRDQERFDAERDHRLTAEGLVATVGHNVEVPQLVRLYVALSGECTTGDGAATEFFAERYRTIVGGIADDIRGRQASGEITDGIEAETIASLLVAAADGLQLQWIVDGPAVDMGERLAQLWEILRAAP